MPYESYERLLARATQEAAIERRRVRAAARGAGDQETADVGAGSPGTGVPGRLKLVVSVTPEEYAELERTAQNGEGAVLAESITTVEIKQADGLLSHERRPLWIDVLGLHNAMKLGVPRGGVPVSVLLHAEERPDDRRD